MIWIIVGIAWLFILITAITTICVIFDSPPYDPQDYQLPKSGANHDH